MSIESDGGWDDDDYHRRYYDSDEPEPTKPAATAGFDGLTIATAEAEALEAALKKRMSSLLKSQHNLAAARTAMYTARGTAAEFSQGYENAKAIPDTGNADVLSQAFAASEDRFQQAMLAQRASAEAEWAEHMARLALAELVGAFKEILESIKGARPELAQSVVIQAATHLLGPVEKSATLRASSNANPQEPAPYAEVDQDLHDKLVAGNLALAVLVAQAQSLVAPTTAARAEVELCRNCSDVIEPTRPTEEEVQRYLAQLEARTKARQKAHREGHKAFAAQTAMLNELNKAQESLTALFAQFNEIANPAPQLAAVVATTRVVQEAAKVAIYHLNRACDYDHSFKARLDTTVNPHPSKAELKQIETLRIGLREVGYSLGRLNEALASQRATKSKKAVTVERTGVGGTASLAGAQAWLEEIKARTKEAGKLNHSREVKLELLEESVKAFKEEVLNNKTALHRLVITTLPKRNQKPCDELRALLNAAAWMYESLDEREGGFPLY
ncbi:MAG: hypothetical protein JST01_25535 [Cyanobacteria bacterium SZAS TMP-1]|nr:hypothetical protein [Cyanobacteria bacterium SZAS TMP-1]